ncbi:MAG: hypothetical protein C0405_14625, partial [Desulfovibrio sp.]|nr:hypothetical protein [Desulfovibrio sp.]
SLIEAQSKYAKGHPELEMAQGRVQELTQLIKEEMGKSISLDSAYATLRTGLVQTYAELAGLEAQEKAWPIVLSRYEKDLLTHPDKIARQAFLDLNVKAGQNVYQLYQEYSQKIKLAAEAEIRTLHLVEAARLTPEDESKPKMTTVLAVTLALATFFGLGVIFFLEFVDTSVHGVEDLDLQGRYPYLGLVKGGLAPAPRLVAVGDPNSPDHETVRSLRHALRLAQGSDPAPHLVLTSPVGEEGKNFLAANLAVGLAREGRKVLLVDGDLRGPRLHQFFDLENSRGWGAANLNSADLTGLARPTKVDGLSLLAAGPAPENIGGLVESPLLARLLKQARESYDQVLLVGPPLLATSDSLIFG